MRAHAVERASLAQKEVAALSLRVDKLHDLDLKDPKNLGLANYWLH